MSVMMTAKQAADELWGEYLRASDRASSVSELEEAWGEYQEGLSQANIIATLGGYRFASSQKAKATP